MLCFLPPIPGAPRSEALPPRRTIVGVALALGLVIVGMVLPHLRLAAHPTDRPRATSGSSPE